MYSRFLFIRFTISIISVFVFTALPSAARTPPRPDNPFIIMEEGILFKDDFQDGNADGWALGPGWNVSRETGNHFLSGCRHSFAIPNASGWSDYTVEVRFRMVKGRFHFNLRENTKLGHIRYFLAVHTNSLALHKQLPSDSAA